MLYHDPGSAPWLTVALSQGKVVKKVRVEDAIGMALGHDLTEIRAEKGLKHRAFRRGHIVRPEDVERWSDPAH